MTFTAATTPYTLHPFSFSFNFVSFHQDWNDPISFGLLIIHRRLTLNADVCCLLQASCSSGEWRFKLFMIYFEIEFGTGFSRFKRKWNFQIGILALLFFWYEKFIIQSYFNLMFYFIHLFVCRYKFENSAIFSKSIEIIFWT